MTTAAARETTPHVLHVRWPVIDPDAPLSRLIEEATLDWLSHAEWHGVLTDLPRFDTREDHAGGLWLEGSADVLAQLEDAAVLAGTATAAEPVTGCASCEDIEFLLRAGEDTHAIAARLGVKHASLLDHLRRHGRPDLLPNPPRNRKAARDGDR